MKLLHIAADRRVCLALSLAFIGQVGISVSAFAETPITTVNPRVAPAAVAVETVIDRDVVYSPVNEEVKAHLQPLPAVQAPVDNLKQQIANRLNSGLISGKLTVPEADEVQRQLDDIERQEAEFKMGGYALSDGAINNLMRKYYMVDQRLTDLANNTNFLEYMPNFELRRIGIERNIQNHLAAGNLTPGEAEQLLTAVATISDGYATSQATGGTVTATELEALHRDLAAVNGKLTQKINGTIAFVAPATHDKLAELQTTIQCAVASKQFSDAERRHMLDQYGRLIVLQESIIADDGPRAEDIQVLAKEIDNLNFILTRELRDRQIAAHHENRM
jgi:hypothetical protein